MCPQHVKPYKEGKARYKKGLRLVRPASPRQHVIYILQMYYSEFVINLYYLKEYNITAASTKSHLYIFLLSLSDCIMSYIIRMCQKARQGDEGVASIILVKSRNKFYISF